MKSRNLKLISGLILIACLLSCGDRGKSPARVILVTIDTLRHDALGAYGQPGIYTPFLDSIARESTQYIFSYSPIPTTVPAHISLLTGLYPVRHGIRANAGYYLTNENVPDIASILHSKNYQTAAFVSLQNLGSSIKSINAFSVISNTGFGWQRHAKVTLDAAKEWMNGNSGEHIFLWVHLFDPHTPYSPPAPFHQIAQKNENERYQVNFPRCFLKEQDSASPDLRYYRGLYDGEVAYVDLQLSRFFCSLSDNGLLEDTLVILTSDHGESFGEQDLFFDHSWRVSEANIRVPMMFWFPGKKNPGEVKTGLARLIDIKSTILSILGIEHDPGDGSTLFSDGKFISPNNHFSVSEIGATEVLPEKRERAVTDGHKKLYSVPDPTLFLWTDHPETLYDLNVDPGEYRGEVPGIDKDLLPFREALDLCFSDDRAVETHEIDASEMAMLKSLGYLETLPNDQFRTSDAEPNRVVHITESPQIIEPQDNAVSCRRLRFAWLEIPAAAAYSVRFNSIYSHKPSQTVTVTDPNLDKIVTPDFWSRLTPNIYTWSVAAIYEDGTLSEYSPQHVFTMSLSAANRIFHENKIRLEAEEMPGNTGLVKDDTNASGKKIVSYQSGQGSGYMLFGPYMELPAGEYTALFNLKFPPADSNSPPVWLDIVTHRGERILAQKPLKTPENPLLLSGFFPVELPFSHDGNGMLEFRVFCTGYGSFDVDCIDILPLGVSFTVP